ncbi:MAG: autotransporter-associated beta strand repeat-containing protein [Chthoniobacterales bacterium]
MIVRSRTAEVVKILVAILAFLLLSDLSLAGSGVWLLNPTSDDWNTAANWSSNTVPNGFGDSAAFGVSNTTTVLMSAPIELFELSFNVGASAYVITALPNTALSADAGIVNDSGSVQNFLAAADETGAGLFQFDGRGGGSGELTTFVLEGGRSTGSQAGGASFNGTSAMSSTFVCGGGTVAGALGSFIDILGSATLSDATILTNGGEAAGANGAVTTFYLGDANSAMIAANGGLVSGAGGAITLFLGTSRADAAILIANGGTDGGTGGLIEFHNMSAGGTARVEVFGNGNLDIGSHSGGVTIGSLEGDGLVFLGAQALSVGSNSLSTTFSGVIQDRGISGRTGGSLIKVGTTTLTLTGANIYTGGTTVSAGTLVVSNTTGSGTGNGAVNVSGGTFGGKGVISGAVTVNSGAFLAPAHGTKAQSTLTIQSQLTFNAGSTYTYTFKAKKKQAKTDKVIATGVTIASGASFNLSGTTKGTLTRGLTLTVISNTSPNPISGTFSNLADGAIVTVNGNNFQACYEGGDGNDLTLTVVP